MPQISLSELPLADALRDYTQIRRLAMQSLFDSLDTLCEGTVVVDLEARIVWINEPYAQALGLADTAAALGKPVEDVIPHSLMREVVQSGRPILLDIMETNGKTFVVTRIPLKDEQGEIVGRMVLQALGIEGDGIDPRSVIVPTELIARRSTDVRR